MSLSTMYTMDNAGFPTTFMAYEALLSQFLKMGQLSALGYASVNPEQPHRTSH